MGTRTTEWLPYILLESAHRPGTLGQAVYLLNGDALCSLRVWTYTGVIRVPKYAGVGPGM